MDEKLRRKDGYEEKHNHSEIPTKTLMIPHGISLRLTMSCGKTKTSQKLSNGVGK